MKEFALVAQRIQRKFVALMSKISLCKVEVLIIKRGIIGMNNVGLIRR